MAIVKIEKIIEFAKEGQRSIEGLVLDLGFPRAEKPAREWFNYLFNKSFSSINMLIDQINQMRADIELLKEVAADVILPPVVEGGDSGTNPVGGWTLEQEPRTPDFISYNMKHSSLAKILDVTLTIEYLRPNDVPFEQTQVQKIGNTNDVGEASILTYNGHIPLDGFPNVRVTVSSPNTTPLTKKFKRPEATFVSGSGGGNANQTE